ncbi:putative sporulation protein YtxC [Paenibacillus caui]|uniref:putative sporulation protein YtxC n=1 Tax=Paenibacillus caui TaxID=2873927 RepID=UPI001CA7CA08|nr:putative sporulation protein YtxC [Paenibacillus caui]
MQLFTITTSVDSRQAAEDFCEAFRESAIGLNHSRSAGADYRFAYEPGRVTVICENEGSTPLSSRTLKGLKTKAAEMITEHVIEKKEPFLLRRLLYKYYSLYNHEDVPAIVKLAVQILDGWSDYEVHKRSRERRIAEIYSSFHDYLQTSSVIDIDGWISFRMPGFMEELKDALDLAVDEYLLDKQYEEFIELLKYFVQFQDTRIPLIHLNHIKGTEFEFLDEKMLPVQPLPEFTGITITMEDQELQMEDAVVSSLISLSPGKIMIHTREPELRMIATIQEIFGDRAQLCSD